jgi:hypothetical protein
MADFQYDPDPEHPIVKLRDAIANADGKYQVTYIQDTYYD